MRELWEPMDAILIDSQFHGDYRTTLCVELWPLLVPVRLLLIGLGQPKNIAFGPRRSADLHADWQPRLGESARHGDGRQTKNVEGPCIAQRKNLFCAEIVHISQQF